MTTLPRPTDKLLYYHGNDDFMIIEPTIEQITEQVLALDNQDKTMVIVYIPDQAVSIRGGNSGRVILIYSSFGMRKAEDRTLISTDELFNERFIEIATQHELDKVPLFTTITKEVALAVALAFYRERAMPSAPEGTKWKG